MLRALVFTTLFFVMPGAAPGQPPGVLHIKVALVDTERKATPVARHALLISENPASAVPRRIVTALDGTANVSLRPGNYTVESDRPVVFQGHAYQWTELVDIAAGRDAVLELTIDNAEDVPVTAAEADTAAPLEAELTSLLAAWQDSVVALWTPTAHASGFVIDASGLVATSGRAIGDAASVEVQFTPAVKVAASVLATDLARDVAVLWIDPKIAASVRAVPLGCAQTAKPPVTEGQEVVAIGAPLREPKGPAFGTAGRVEGHTIASDLILPTGSAGGPVFAAGGVIVGLTSSDEASAGRGREKSRIVRVERLCDIVASAEKKMQGAAPPGGTLLPVEPVPPFPVDALKEAAKGRVGSLNPYQISSSEFDVAFITPVLTFGAQYLSEQMSGRERSKGTGAQDVSRGFARPLEFGNW